MIFGAPNDNCIYKTKKKKLHSSFYEVKIIILNDKITKKHGQKMQNAHDCLSNDKMSQN